MNQADRLETFFEFRWSHYSFNNSNEVLARDANDYHYYHHYHHHPGGGGGGDQGNYNYDYDRNNNGDGLFNDISFLRAESYS